MLNGLGSRTAKRYTHFKEPDALDAEPIIKTAHKRKRESGGLAHKLSKRQNRRWFRVRTKIGLAIEIFLVIAAVAALIYNFSTEKEISYFTSIAAVFGTIGILARDIYQNKRNTNRITVITEPDA